MSLELVVTQSSDLDALDVLLAHGRIPLANATSFVCRTFSPEKMSSGSSSSNPRVVEINDTCLSISTSSFRPDDFAPLWSSREPLETNDFNTILVEFYGRDVESMYDYPDLLEVIRTYATAWGQEHPEELGSVLDKLEAIEGMSV